MNNPRPRDVTSPVRPARRTNHSDLSRTTPPQIARDLKLWPSWTRVPIEQLGFRLPGVDSRHHEVGGGE